MTKVSGFGFTKSGLTMGCKRGGFVYPGRLPKSIAYSFTHELYLGTFFMIFIKYIF